MIHLYCGDGKGKTTAACGLALRAAGAGKSVLFVQFFKNGNSSEVKMLEQCGVSLILPEVYHGRYGKMSDPERIEIRREYDRIMNMVMERARGFELIVLDESVSAFGYQCIDQENMLAFLRKEGEQREIVLTGRNPAQDLLETADYITEMKKVRHPFDRGVKARKGIEF